MDISKNKKENPGSRRRNICEEKKSIRVTSKFARQNHDERANNRATTASDADHSMGFSAEAAPVKVAMLAEEVVVV